MKQDLISQSEIREIETCVFRAAFLHFCLLILVGILTQGCSEVSYVMPKKLEQQSLLTTVNNPPTVTVTSPTVGANLNGTIDLTANAVGGDHEVLSVQFFVDGVAVGPEDTTSPFSFSLDTTTITNGAHSVTARVKDLSGVQVTSKAISFNVFNVSSVGLVAAFSFNEGSGTAAKDSSASDLAATLTDASWDNGKFGSSVAFNGASSYVSVVNASALKVTDKLTMEAWVYPTQLDPLNGIAERSILVREETSTVSSFALYGAKTDTPRIVAQARSGTSLSKTGTKAPSLSLQVWIHLAVTYESPNLQLYVNGVLVAQRSNGEGNLINSNASLFIGGWPGMNEFFAGRIDEVRIYNRVLSEEEIKADMNIPIR